MKKLEYYTASWCGPCRMVKPTVEKLIKENYNIEIVDIEEDEMAAVRKDISSVPTFVLYDDGVEVGRASGAASESDIRGWLI